MKRWRIIQVTLCITLIMSVYCQTEEQQTTDSSRDLLFIKPKGIVLQKLNRNKTRFTDEEKAMILQIHNSYRSVVLPPATDMRELVWDDDLENYAWNHTQQCTGAHSAGTMVKKWYTDDPSTWETWVRMGENLYYRVAPYYSALEAMWLYWEEGSKYDIFTDNCTHSNTCGHYRVLTTNKSSRVGCAINTCDNFTVSKYPTPAVFFSCSYDGSYNYWDKPYTVGERGSYCNVQPYDYNTLRYGLCTHPYMVLKNIGFDGNTGIVELPSEYLTTTTTTAMPTAITTMENINITKNITTETQTTLSSPSSDSSTFISIKNSTLFPPSTKSTMTYPSRETSTSTIGLESSTQQGEITSVYLETSTEQKSTKRTVSHAVKVCVWLSHYLLVSLVLTIAVLI